MKVSSPQICRVLDHGLQQGRMFQAVERLQGQSLAEAMTSNPGPMSEAQTKAMAIQILLGLEAAHMGGLTHSNLVPANVFVDSRIFFFITFGSSTYGGIDTQQSGACKRVRGQQEASKCWVLASLSGSLRLCCTN